MAGFLPIYGVVDLMMKRLGGRVVHAQIALEGQGRLPGLGLADEVDGQEPGCQRQLSMHYHRAGRKTGLVPASGALENVCEHCDRRRSAEHCRSGSSASD